TPAKAATSRSVACFLILLLLSRSYPQSLAPAGLTWSNLFGCPLTTAYCSVGIDSQKQPLYVTERQMKSFSISIQPVTWVWLQRAADSLIVCRTCSGT